MRARRRVGPIARAALVVLAAGGAWPAAAAAPAERTLYLMLDAVPYSLMDRITDPERREPPLFRDFARPVPLISTFPSSTSVAAAGIFEPLGLERSPGYEARFFDWQRQAVRGGGAISYFRIDFAWRDFFDWSRKGVVRSAVGALRPLRASNFRLREAIRAFFETDDPDFFAYVETTDTAAHLKGPDSLEPVLETLDRELGEARRSHPDEAFRVVLFSDHGIDGGEPLVNVWKPLKRALAGAGFRFSRRLREARDVALTPYGLVSSFEIYTRPESTEQVARAAAAVGGVDLCVCRAGDGWLIESARGRAWIHSTRTAQGQLWSYRPQTGDPLEYRPVVDELRRRAGSTATTYFADSWWLEATAEHHYPDAIHRLVRSFDLVVNAASVLCSVAPGHMFGLETTEMMARLTQGRLRWTHGALDREASFGFIMSDGTAFETGRPVRFSDSLRPFLGDPDTGHRASGVEGEGPPSRRHPAARLAVR